MDKNKYIYFYKGLVKRPNFSSIHKLLGDENHRLGENKVQAKKL